MQLDDIKWIIAAIFFVSTGSYMSHGTESTMNKLSQFSDPTILDVFANIDKDGKASLVSPPPILYHYRSLGNLNKFDFFKDKVLWRSSPATFNDPFDCKILVRFDLFTHEQLLTYVKDSIKIRCPDISRHILRQEARNILKKKSEYLKELRQGYIDGINLHTGVTCFSLNNNNIQLWSYYAGEHEGICFGFDTSKICSNRNFGVGGAVQYVNEMPTLRPSLSEQDNHTITRLFMLYKHSKWAHEEEFRLIKAFSDEHEKNDCRRGVLITPDVLKEVIFGYRIDSLTRESIISKAKHNFPRVQFYEAELDNESFNMRIIPINQSS